MQGRYGLMVSERPFERYRAVYKYRLAHGLPCIDGPLNMCDLACVRVRNAMARAIRSCCEGLIVAEECHFGFVDNVEFFAMKLMSDNVRELIMTKVSSFEYKNGVIVAESMLEVFNASLEITTVVEDKVDNVDLVEFISDEPAVIMPVNQPIPSQVMVGFDVYEHMYKDPVVESDIVENFTTVIVEDDAEATYIQMPLSRYIPLEDKIYAITDGVCTLKCDGGRFRVRDQVTGEYVNKDTIQCEELDEYIPFLVKAKENLENDGSVRVTVRNTTRYTISVDGEYRRDCTMSLFAHKFANKCKMMIDDFLARLKMMPTTLLVNHNINVLEGVIIGYKMPSREILNQIAQMIGKPSLCSKGYDVNKERWKPYRKWENWRIVVRKRYKSDFVFTSPLSVFDNKEFKYNSCDLYSAQERKLWQSHSVFGADGLDYLDFIEFCRKEYEWNKSANYHVDAERQKFLYYQFVIVSGLMPPLECQENRREDDDDFYVSPGYYDFDLCANDDNDEIDAREMERERREEIGDEYLYDNNE